MFMRRLGGCQRHLDGVAPAEGALIVFLDEALADHHLFEVGGIELVGHVLADAVVLREVALEGLAVAHLVGDDAAVTQHAALVHRHLEHLLGQAVETCHRLGRSFEAERLCQREVGIEDAYRVLLGVDALERTAEERLGQARAGCGHYRRSPCPCSTCRGTDHDGAP